MFPKSEIIMVPDGAIHQIWMKTYQLYMEVHNSVLDGNQTNSTKILDGINKDVVFMDSRRYLTTF